jgi:hypothetical protein
MSFQVSRFFEEAYTSAAELLLQQTESKLSNLVTRGSYKGKIVSPVKQFGTMKVRKVTDRYGTLGMQDVPLTRRWVVPVDYEVEPAFVDRFDLLRITTDNGGNAEVSDLAQGYARTLQAAVNREMDKIIMANFFSAALVGESGSTTTVTFPSTQEVANTVGSGAVASGLNIEKIKEANKILQNNEVYQSQFGKYYMLISPTQNQQLLQDIQATNNVYADAMRPVYSDDGMIKSLLGMEFVTLSENQFTEAGLKSGSNWTLPVWVKDGMHMANWLDATIEVYKDTQRTGHPTGMYTMFTANATRTQEGKVVRVLAVS